MENQNTIKCPHCGFDINVSEVLTKQTEEKIKNEYSRKTAELEKSFLAKQRALENEKQRMVIEREKEQEIIDNMVREKLKNLSKELENKYKKEIADENAAKMEELEKELNQKNEQLRDLNRAKAEVERLKREKDNIQEQVALEKEKELNAKLTEEKQRIRAQAEEEWMLRLKEKDKTIDDMTSQLKIAQRKAEQGSMQLQGEIQELELEALLRNTYPYDEIEEVKKGQRGADVIQTVRNEFGMPLGKIYYESKRTKSFDNSWIQKLRDDNLELKAEMLVLVTEAMPDQISKYLYKDGVWICNFMEVRWLSLIVRQSLIEISRVNDSQNNKTDKMNMLYNYLTSQEFRGQFEAIIEGFKALQDSYGEEKLKMQKIWKEREKQLDKILTNCVQFYGSLKGIASTSIPDIKMLEDSKQKLL